MSSPITFSGFNNIDFNTIVNALMQQASQPLTALQDRQKALQTQVSSFDQLNSRVSTLRSAADGLSTLSQVETLAGTSSDASAASVSVSSSAIEGHYDVVVTELARAQVTASASAAPDANTTVVASGGTLTIGGVDVSINGDVTLQQLASAINSTNGIGVSAAVVRTGASSYRLALTSLETGVQNAFTITNNLTGGSGITFSGTNAVDASDAAILLNNIPVTNSSNTFADVVPGVTITAIKKDASKTIGIDVAPDTTSLKAKVTSFVNAYNSVIKFIDTQRTSANGGEAGSIGREPLLRQLRGALRDELIGTHGSATFTRLTEVGIEFTTSGTIQLNESKFNAAVAANPDDVRTLFAGAGGAFPAVEAMLDTYSQSSGVIPGVKDRLNKQITAMDTQISAMQARLSVQRATLQRQFSEADAAMSRLNGQSGAIGNIGSGLGSF